MNKEEGVKEARAKYVQDRVNNSTNKASIEVAKLSQELFLSKKTIYDDLKK